MAEHRTGQQEGYERLPIKLILPKQGKERAIPPGGAKSAPFIPVDSRFRTRLRNEVVAIRDAVTPQVRRTGSAPVRVKLLPKAVAKSHRPEKLFSQASCPIIGAGRLGELFIKVTPDSLSRLADVIEKNESQGIVKELSAVQIIEPVTPKFRRKDMSPLDILRRSPRKNDGFITRVRLFDFGEEKDQDRVFNEFQAVCDRQNLTISQGGYSSSSHVYAVECKTVEDVETLSNVVGVRSITQMPTLRMLRPRIININPLSFDLPRADQIENDFPVVVVVDSGISDQFESLKTWTVGRISDVSTQYRNTGHGTFVAGLICWGAQLNPNLHGIDDSPCGVFDLQVIPNADPAHGETEELTEQQFLQSLETALKQYANKYKVWNLSLGTDEVCSLDEFSALAEQLDNFQEKYAVSFVISAGNYESLPLLEYPRRIEQLEAGRITSPADSVLGITVGSISHIDYAKNGPKRHHPSAFSRHGAGPNYVIKPDLIHYGGTCSNDFQHQAGVRSITQEGAAGEDLGTSFATPLVSRTLAQIYHQITPTPSPVLARALLTHHARDPRENGRVLGHHRGCEGCRDSP